MYDQSLGLALVSECAAVVLWLLIDPFVLSSHVRLSDIQWLPDFF